MDSTLIRYDMGTHIKAVASGATVTDIAEVEGIGRTMFYRSVRAIEHALSARREYLTKEGKIRYGGPDHYARLAATKHFRDFLAAGRPPAPKQEENAQAGITLYQLGELCKAADNPVAAI